MQTAESALMDWWFNGFGGLGGWWFFALLAFAAVAYVWFDSQGRHATAVEWKLGILVPALLIIPTVIYWFSPAVTKVTLLGSLELIFLLGLIGGIMPLGVAIAYWIAGPPSNPLAASAGPVHESRAESRGERAGFEVDQETTPRPRATFDRAKKIARGWLMGQDSRQYQLYKGQTTIGRAKVNDLVFGDPSVSHEQCLIREEQDVFTLFDRASRYGTFLNGKRIASPEILRNGDMISFGDTRLKFVGERE